MAKECAGLQLDVFRGELDKLILIVINTGRLNKSKVTVKDILLPMYEGEKHGGTIVELFLLSHSLTALATLEGRAWLKVQIGI